MPGPSDRALATIDALIQTAHDLSADAFEQRLGPAVLVGSVQTSEDEDENHWSFHTFTGSVTDIASTTNEPKAPLRGNSVFALKKAKPGPFATTVLIGRADSNDVCIPHPSLSKLHARIQLQPDGTLVLTEAGSKNGTMVNGRPVKKGDPVPIEHGAQITFGAVWLTVHRTRRLHSVLRRLPP